MSAFDEYLTTITPEPRQLFLQMRAVVQEVVQPTEEGVSYGMPALLYRGKPLVSFMVTKKFLSLYPFSGKVVAALRNELVDFECTSGSIHFSVTKPLPRALLQSIVQTRAREIAERE